MVRVVSDLSFRGLRRHERLERLKAMRPPGVRVVPTSDDYRRLLKHPHAGGFGKQGGKEWPDDRFTRRRIAEGAIKLEESKSEKGQAPRRDRDTSAA